MTSPTKHLEIFDEKFARWHDCETGLKNMVKQHLIKTVINVLEQQIKEVESHMQNGIKFNHFMEHHMQHGYQKGLQVTLDSLTTTLSTWRALL